LASDRNGSFDLFSAERADRNAPFATTTPITELNTTGDEMAPELSADGLEIFFVRSLAGTTMGFDLYTSSRPDPASPFAPATRVAELSSARDEYQAGLSDDGATIFFTFDATIAVTTNSDIWTSTRSRECP
jgi:hypothetical protein